MSDPEMVKVVKPWQPEKAFSQIVMPEPGMINDAMWQQPEKALFPILRMVSGKVSERNPSL
jgi:hypothetical protein